MIDLCPPIIKKCKFLCQCVNPSQKSSQLHIKRGWVQTCQRLQNENSRWNEFLWKAHQNVEKMSQLQKEKYNILVEDLKDFIFDDKVDIDILRKCFLMQVCNSSII